MQKTSEEIARGVNFVDDDAGITFLLRTFGHGTCKDNGDEDGCGNEIQNAVWMRWAMEMYVVMKRRSDYEEQVDQTPRNHEADTALEDCRYDACYTLSRTPSVCSLCRQNRSREDGVPA